MGSIAHTAPLRRRQAGFTVIEVLVASLVLTIGLLSAFTAIQGGNRLGNHAELIQTAAAVGERELARVESLKWEDIALEKAPTVNSGASTNLNDPTHYLSTSGTGSGPVSKCSEANPCYQWDWNESSTAEALNIEKSTDPTADPSEWTETISSSNGATRLSGKVYRFITWVNDKNCKAEACGGENDYLRVSVVVTVNSFAGTAPPPVKLSTLITNPAGANLNPLTNSAITCNDHGTSKPCVE